jgi:hypothetical protein
VTATLLELCGVRAGYDAVTIGLGAVTVTIAGSALFLRYSLTGFLRFWMARQSHELAVLADRLDRDPSCHAE